MPHPATAPKRRLIPYAGWEPPPVRKPRPKLAVVESTRPAIEEVKRSAPRRRGPNLKPEVKAEMRRLEDQGVQRFEIAQRLDLTPSTVTKALGAKRGSPRLPADTVLEKLREGHAKREVARNLGVHVRSVQRLAKRSKA